MEAKAQAYAAHQLDVLKMVLILSKHQTPMSVIINKSINSGIVPEDMKFARERPNFKKNIPLDVSNYRPVSILSIVLEIIDRPDSTQLNDFITK